MNKQYQEERAYIEDFKSKILSHKNITQGDLVKLITNYEELTEIASVSTKIIDRLMINYDSLKNSTAS